ncbi:hypothetical protein AWB79_04518 [Caballeronia hypogeia]|uniref:Uncharacterized protein n=1 Tax=Caballeronia hypogeia TaxID=1777140 RepID=A0A158C0S0_9BURK|nr:hypothetical protein AWB79_04518 [Caballeronia hypogeia]
MRAQDIAFKWSVVMLALGRICAVISWLLVPWIIEVLFQ